MMMIELKSTDLKKNTILLQKAVCFLFFYYLFFQFLLDKRRILEKVLILHFTDVEILHLTLTKVFQRSQNCFYNKNSAFEDEKSQLHKGMSNS